MHQLHGKVTAMSFMPFAKTILRNLVSKPATQMYPIQKRTPVVAARGHIAIDIDACIYCGACMRKCPTHAIATEKPGRTWQIDRLRCIQCNACVGVCPKKCLYMRPDYTPPTVGQQVDRFHSDALPAPVKPVSNSTGSPSAPAVAPLASAGSPSASAVAPSAPAAAPAAVPEDPQNHA